MRGNRWLEQALKVAGMTADLARREIALLSILMLIAGSLWLFMEIADEVVEGEIDHIDRLIFLAFRNPANIEDPLGPAWLEEAALEITALGSFAVLGLITVAAIIWWDPLESTCRHASLSIL